MSQRLDEGDEPLVHRLLEALQRLFDEQAAEREERRADREQRRQQTAELSRMATELGQQNRMIQGLAEFLSRNPIGMSLSLLFIALLFGGRIIEIYRMVSVSP